MNPTEKELTQEVARECAEKIVQLTGFGQALHVNDILPDIKDVYHRAYLAGRQSVVEDTKRELLRSLKSWAQKQEKDVNFSYRDVLSHLSWLEQRIPDDIITPSK